MSKIALQIVNATLGLLTVALASMQLIFGANSPVYRDAAALTSPMLDSNLRFFGGMALSLGGILLWITPRIERHTTLFRAVWICAMLGGIGRLVSIPVAGMPSLPLVVFTVIEVIGAPLLIVWQDRIAHQTPRTHNT